MVLSRRCDLSVYSAIDETAFSKESGFVKLFEMKSFVIHVKCLESCGGYERGVKWGGIEGGDARRGEVLEVLNRLY